MTAQIADVRVTAGQDDGQTWKCRCCRSVYGSMKEYEEHLKP